jgi:hypothetical protein
MNPLVAKQAAYLLGAFVLTTAATVQLPETDPGAALSLAIMGTAAYPFVITTSFTRIKHWEIRYWGIMMFVVAGRLALNIQLPVWGQAAVVFGVLGTAAVVSVLQRFRGQATAAQK